MLNMEENNINNAKSDENLQIADSESKAKRKSSKKRKSDSADYVETRGHKTDRQRQHERRIKEHIEEAALKGYRRSDLAHFGSDLALPDDNAKAVKFIMELGMLPLIDLSDPEQIRNRVNEYWQLCVQYDTKPLVSGLADALGIDRRRLYELTHDVPGRELGTTLEGRVELKRAYGRLEVLWEHYSVNGKMNPVTSIFLGKNNYGYKDKVELVATTQSKLVDADVESLVEEAKLLPTFTHETE